MTTAEVFADYLGMTPENAPWAYGRVELLQCLSCLRDVREVPLDEQSFMATRCDYCCEYLTSSGVADRLTATSPLAPEPTPGWLETLVRHKKFFALDRTGWDEFSAAWDSGNADIPSVSRAIHPTRAVARVLISADSTLRGECEQASDWEEVK